MNERDIKNYIWVVILIGGILSLISIFTPVSNYIQSVYETYSWMWGLSYFTTGIDSGIMFSAFNDPIYYNLPIFLSGVIPTIMILLISIKLIIKANHIRDGRTQIKDIEQKLIRSGVMLILAPIIYLIATTTLVNIINLIRGYSSFFVLFSTTSPGFAFVSPFIGGALALIGGIVSKYKIAREEVIIPQEKRDIITKTPVQTVKYSTIPQLRTNPYQTTNISRKTNPFRLKNYSKYIGIIGLFGGIITLLSLLTPSFYVSTMGVQEYYWMWGLYYGRISGYGSNLAFIPTQEPAFLMLPIFLAGIIPAIIIFIGSVKLIAITNSIRSGRKDIKTSGNTLIGLGITLITGSIIFIIAIDITMNNLIEYLLYDPYDPYFYIPDFWDIYEPGFAIIGPFLGAVLAIISGVASKTIKTDVGPTKIPEVREFITKTTQTPLQTSIPMSTPTSTPTSAPTISHINFCPECGQNIIPKGSKFCMNCGFELKI